MPLHYFKQECGNNLAAVNYPECRRGAAHASEPHVGLRRTGSGCRTTEKDGGGFMVTACDYSYEIVSFIVGVITIIVILRVPTAIL